jgi:hypothetical protein
MVVRMIAIERRGLSPEFLADLQGGMLAPLRERVVRDRSLCLELRENYINVYYRGGNVMRVCPTDEGYSAFFDRKYFGGAEAPMPMPPDRLRKPEDVGAWLSALPSLKQAMDLWQPGEEREVQQLVLRDNNVGGCARATSSTQTTTGASTSSPSTGHRHHLRARGRTVDASCSVK